MHYKILILIFKIMVAHLAHSLTCDEILELPADKRFSLQELQSIQHKDMVECLAHLGKEQLGEKEADFIWRSLITYYENIANVPEKVLTLLHWVTPAVTPNDYENITLSSIDVIENFGLNYNLDEGQLSAIADRVRDDFGGKEPEDYTYYDLKALRQILCAFNRSEIERIHPMAYREAAIIIGKLDRCKPDVMSGFAGLAVQESAFGLPETWSESTLKIVGAVAEYLPEVKEKHSRSSVQKNS